MSTAVGMANNRLCEGFMLSLQLGTAICYQYVGAYFPATYANNRCSLCGPKRSHAFNSASFKHNKLGLAVGRSIFAISPQDYARNDLRRSEIQNFPWGACPQTPLEGALRVL